MSRQYTRNLDELRILPEGWIEDLVFEINAFHRCGQAEMGIGVRIGNQAGGVLTLDDMAAICTVFSKHFKQVADATKKAKP